ncbi:MAG: TetR/AcrR family transcriptional regulator [Thermomicrobiales bacterium]
MEHSGKGDPAKSIALLWRKRGESMPIGRSGLTVDSIVDAAIELADETSLAELSMRAIAKRLGVGVMSLYTHIPGKNELIDLMVDTVSGEVAIPIRTDRGWRSDIEDVVANYRRLCLRHRWLVYIIETRPVIGPNTLAAWNVLLTPLDGIGLTEVEMDRITSLLGGFVTTSARREIELANVERVTGESLNSWWMSNEALLTRVMDTSTTPVAERVGNVVQEGDLDQDNLRTGFAFQLDLLLNGIELLINTRTAAL